MVTFSISPQEAEIIEDIEEVGYGELRVVLTPTDVAGDKIEVTKHEAFQLLLKELQRREMFDTIIIHGSLPAYATIASHTASGRLCVKKFKFS